MLSGSWFNSRNGRPGPPKNKTEAGPSGPRKSSLDVSHTPSGPDPSAADEPKKRALTTAINTPHDAVLAELQGHRPEHDPAAQIDIIPGAASGLGGGAGGGVGALSSAAEDGETILSSTTGSPNLPSLVPKAAQGQTLYDPFTGAPLGIIPSPVPGSSTSVGGQSGKRAENDRQELWAQLGKIRGLQADIAAMHVTMENIGGFGEKAAKRGARVRRQSTGGERLEEAGTTGDDWTSEEWQKKDRDAEFELSESRFVGRKEEIDAIMSKLGELSQSLVTFHALDTPSVDFENATRSNTQTSAAIPPSPSSPNLLNARHPSLMRLSTDDSDPLLESPASLMSPLPFENYGHSQEPSRDL